MALADATLIPGAPTFPIGSDAHATARDYFFVVMASIIAVIVFVGFAPSFYLRGVFHSDQGLSILLHVHGFALSAWIILFLVQTLLVARGLPTLHRSLGWVMVGLAASIVVLMGAGIVEQMQRTPPDPPPPVALALGAFDIIVFATLVSSAIYLRKRSAWHKRLLLSATLLLVGAPAVRIVVMLGVHDLLKIMLLWPSLDRCSICALLHQRLDDSRQSSPCISGGPRVGNDGSGRPADRPGVACLVISCE